MDDQSQVPCPMTTLPSIIVYPLHVIPSKMLATFSSGHLHVWLVSSVCVCWCVCKKKKGAGTGGDWAYVYAKERDRMSEPANQFAAVL